MNLRSAFLLFLGFYFSSFSQEKKCGSVEAIEKSLQNFPEKRQVLETLNSFTKEFIEQHLKRKLMNLKKKVLRLKLLHG